MEVSSHALELHRADAIHWRVAVFTNLTQDHLDFHPTMEDYFAAKRRLFDAGARRCAWSNVDDPYGRRPGAGVPGRADGRHRERRRATCARPICARTSAARRFRADGLELRVGAAGRVQRPQRALRGRRGACTWASRDATIAAALPAAATRAGPLPAGRRGPGLRACVVDYAHTPDSLENVLRAARGLARGRVIAVFGCGGDRDRGKRPLMGEIAAREADAAIVTSDNPRSEDPDAIIAEILAGVPASAARPRRGDRGPPRGDRARRRAGARGRRRRDRRQGPRAGPGAGRRAQGPVRRRRRRARGAGGARA